MCRLVQGLQQIGRRKEMSEEKVSRLVVHELLRVFGDTVESDEDMNWLWKAI